jgi:hypothetical protein
MASAFRGGFGPFDNKCFCNASFAGSRSVTVLNETFLSPVRDAFTVRATSVISLGERGSRGCTMFKGQKKKKQKFVGSEKRVVRRSGVKVLVIGRGGVERFKR